MSYTTSTMLSYDELFNALTELGFSTNAPNFTALHNAATFLGEMDYHQLDASGIDGGELVGVHLHWKSPFNGNRAIAFFEEDGSVTVATGNAIADPDEIRTWWVNDFEKPFLYSEDALNLSMRETIEHLRCVLWADYTV